MAARHDMNQRLVARLYYNSDGAGGARWAFFAIFLVVVIICVFGAIRINKKRSRQGIQPIYGTRWMTPPSYYQSQGQYNQPARRDPEIPNAYVPTYTATANADDMGYYAADGTYHPNPNVKGPVFPENVHQRATSNADWRPIQNLDQSGTRVVHDEDAVARPTGPPPSASGVTRPATASSAAPAYSRPG